MRKECTKHLFQVLLPRYILVEKFTWCWEMWMVFLDFLLQDLCHLMQRKLGFWNSEFIYCLFFSFLMSLHSQLQMHWKLLYLWSVKQVQRTNEKAKYKVWAYFGYYQDAEEKPVVNKVKLQYVISAISLLGLQVSCQGTNSSKQHQVFWYSTWNLSIADADLDLV